MGKLYIVPTPNWEFTGYDPKGNDVLKEVDLILAEDTRTSGKLLKHFDINTPMMSHHMHNEHRKLKSIIERLAFR